MVYISVINHLSSLVKSPHTSLLCILTIFCYSLLTFIYFPYFAFKNIYDQLL